MTEVARVAIGLPAALAVAPFIPGAARSRVVRAFAAALICAWAMYPAGFQIGLVIVGAVVTVAAACWAPSPTDPVKGSAHRFAVVLGLILTAAAASTAVDAGAVAAALHRAVGSDRGFVYSLGLLVAVFPAGGLIGSLTRQWSTAIEKRLNDGRTSLPGSLEGAGRYIGWLERVMVYAALTLGHVDVAAIVLTAKSIARFPSFKDEGPAEYFLIGTLLSVICGAAAAMAARMLLGLPAL